MKYDQHGFLTREWAEQNVPGFVELGACCQQAVMLFHDTPVACLEGIEPRFTPEIPAPVVDHRDYVISPGVATYYSGGEAVGVESPGAVFLLLGLIVGALLARILIK